MTDRKPKELRYNTNVMAIRNDEATETKEMIIEGYPLVFEQEAEGYDPNINEFYFESIAKDALDGCDMSDVCGKYNHNDNVLILCRTRNKSLELQIDKEKGLFTRWHLCDTSSNRDIYEMVKTGLLCEGSFAFYIDDYEEWRDENKRLHRKITKIGKLTDVALCPNGWYGELTNLYAARSYGWLESKNVTKAEALKRCNILRLRNINKIKLMEARKCK